MTVKRVFSIAVSLGLLGVTAAASPATIAMSMFSRPGSATLWRVTERVGIDAPETVDQGQRVTAKVLDGGEDGLLEVWGPIIGDTVPERVESHLARDGVFTFVAPIQAGSYELRLVDPQGRVRASAPLEVVASPLVLSAPVDIFTGEPLPVVWVGPSGIGDRIRLVDPSDGTLVSEMPAEGMPGVPNVATLRAPDRPGTYELQYLSGKEQSELQSLAIEVKKSAWPHKWSEDAQGEGS